MRIPGKTPEAKAADRIYMACLAAGIQLRLKSGLEPTGVKVRLKGSHLTPGAPITALRQAVHDHEEALMYLLMGEENLLPDLRNPDGAPSVAKMFDDYRAKKTPLGPPQRID